MGISRLHADSIGGFREPLWDRYSWAPSLPSVTTAFMMPWMVPPSVPTVSKDGSPGGTALAFLFKMFLTIATGASYVQQLWLTISKRPSSIDQIDGMFDILKDAGGFIDISLWVRNPLLALTAIVTWLIPITAIVTPGTLTVQLQAHLSTQDLQVPALDFESDKFYFMNDNYAGVWAGPTSAVTRTTLTAATQGGTLSMQPKHGSSSYTIWFYAPMMGCKPWTDTALESFQRQSCDYFRANYCPGEYNSTKEALRYLSWMDDATTTLEDYTTTTYNATIPPFSPVVNASEPFPSNSQSTLLYIYVGQQSYTNLTYAQFTSSDPNETSRGPDVLAMCVLNNASYTLELSFRDFQQSTTLKKLEFVEFWNFPDVTDGTGNADGGVPVLYSYRSVLNAFSSIFIGYMSYMPGVTDGLPNHIMETQIQNTALDPLTRTWSSAEEFATDIMDLFTNVTISYFANANLVTNSTASPLANVTYTTNRNIYSYEAGELWKAYGIGIGVAVLCALIGFRAMMVNGAAFKNSWSTIFRTTRDPELASLFKGSDDHIAGAEPVPASIKRTNMVSTRSGFHLHNSRQGFEPVAVRKEHPSTNENTHEEDVVAPNTVGPNQENGNVGVTRNTSDARSWAKRARESIASINDNEQPQYQIRRKPLSH